MSGGEASDGGTGGPGSPGGDDGGGGGAENPGGFDLARLRRRLIAYSSGAVLLMGLASAVLAGKPLYERLKEAQHAKIEQVVFAKITAVDQFVERASSVARQITSRTRARQLLEELNAGGTELEDYRGPSEKILGDALRLSTEAVGIERLDAGDRPVAAVGEPVGEALWPRPLPRGPEVAIRGPVIHGGRRHLLVAAAIADPQGARSGTDVVLFSFAPVEEALADRTGMAGSEQVFLGLPARDGGGPLVIGPGGDGGSAPAGAPGRPAPPALAEMIGRALSGAGISTAHFSDQGRLVASGPLSKVGWAVAATVPSRELYAAADRQMKLVLGGVVALSLLGAGGVFLLVRPLTGGILIKAGDLEREVAERTAELEAANRELEASHREVSEKERKLREALADLQAAQAQLTEAEKMKSVGRLAAGVAHEVKNPLAVISMGIEYLARKFRGQSEQLGEVFDDMEGAVGRADSVIFDLLDFASPRSSERKDCDLNRVVKGALRLLRLNLAQANIRVAFDPGADLPEVCLDRARVEQAFVNVFLNAISAMPQGGELGVRTRAGKVSGFGDNVGGSFSEQFRAGDTVVSAEVTDTGHGVPAENLPKVFDPFFTTRATGSGTGLGLSVSRSIVEANGGVVEIENREEGGVRVTFSFRAVG